MPIAIDTIERKLRKKEFPDLTALESYFKRMVQNAKEYNEKGSKIYEDAERLRKAMTNFMTKHNPAYKTPGYVPISTPIPGEDANDEEEGNVDTAVVDVPSDTPAKRTSRDRSSRHGQSTPLTAPTPSTSTEQSTSNSFKGLTFQQAQEKIVLDTIKHKTDPE